VPTPRTLGETHPSPLFFCRGRSFFLAPTVACPSFLSFFLSGRSSAPSPRFPLLSTAMVGNDRVCVERHPFLGGAKVICFQSPFPLFVERDSPPLSALPSSRRDRVINAENRCAHRGSRFSPPSRSADSVVSPLFQRQAHRLLFLRTGGMPLLAHRSEPCGASTPFPSSARRN